MKMLMPESRIIARQLLINHFYMLKNKKGLTILQILIWVLVFGLLLAGFFLLLNSERAKTRDAKRVSDITRLQAAFEMLYSEKGSYEEAAIGGCQKPGISVRTCKLSKYLPTIASFKDPAGGEYIVSRVPDKSSYEITFILEKNYDSLKAGQHTLTPDGIK